MKIDKILKLIFYASFSILYVSGTLYYALQQSFVLRVHGIVGLWFLYLFGHFFKAHIWPSLRQMRHRKTGISVWLLLSALSVSVPFLYYLGNDQWRETTILLHTYLGLLVILPLAAHIWLSIVE